VYRAADSAEMLVAWRAAVESTASPTALLLTRQDIPDLALPDRRKQAEGLLRGGYVAEADPSPEVVLLASGSELGLILDAAKLLRAEGRRVQVSSIPSTGLFLEQDAAYRETVVPSGLPVLAVTVALPAVLSPLVGPFGTVMGMERFGASANFKVLDEKFGYTPVNVAARAKAQIADARKTAEVLIAQAKALLA